MNRTVITRERHTAALVASALAHLPTAAMLREADIPFGYQTEEEGESFDDIMASDGGLRDLVRIPVKPSIDRDDPLTAWALSHGIEVIPDNQCMDCGEAVGKVERAGEVYIVCLAALAPDPCCSWSRPL